MSQKEREQLQAELAVLKGLRHPNIVAYYEREHIKSSMDLHIYMEYCEDGDLGKRIKHLSKNNLMAEEDFVWSVFAQLVTALYRCHYGEDPPEVGKTALGLGSDVRPTRMKGSHTMILHRDLKPENSKPREWTFACIALIIPSLLKHRFFCQAGRLWSVQDYGLA